MAESISNYLSEEIIRKIKREIYESYGNEVLFFCWIGDTGKVENYEVVARGTDECVSFPVGESYLPDVIIHNHPDGRLTPSRADMDVAGFVAQRGVGFLIIDNNVENVYTVVEPVEKKVLKYLDPEICVSYISRGGALDKEIPDFEERDGQKDMVRYVSQAFNNNTILLVEAGTGIGKSFAYLIPSIEWALLNKERVVISTNTINLQEQILKKDLPTLAKILRKDFKYTLMKGRGNYVCINRVMEIAQDMFSFLDEDENEQFNYILDWIEKTEDGSNSDLPFNPSYLLWEKINSKSETCLGTKCRYFSRCFVNKVKREAIKSHIVVTNHHYFLADSNLIDLSTSILPNFDRVIFDEAHRLEDSATSFFTKEITLPGIINLLNQMFKIGKNGKEKGYFSYLRNKGIIENGVFQKLKGFIGNIEKSAKNLFSELSDFIDLLVERSSESFTEYRVFEINYQIQNTPEWDSKIIPLIGDFYKAIVSLEDCLNELRSYLEKRKADIHLKQVDGYTLRIIDIIQTLDIFLKEEDEDYVRWIEKRNDRVLISVALIDVGKKLKEMIYEKSKSTILTSATLTIDNNFDFIKSRLGIGNDAVTSVVSSPFNYSKQMKILIQNDTEEPASPGYINSIANSVKTIIEKTGGNTLILFTSYNALNMVFAIVKNSVESSKYIFLKQGDMSRHRLLEEFKYQKNAVLFGTESFWEGIDVPGDALQCVIITKLPFKVPNDPVIKARMKKIEMEGKNPFISYLLPLAVIKIKQGVGRLIRKKSDKGVIVILDKRIITKNYGRIFLRSLPDASVFISNRVEITEKLEGYLGNKSLTK